MPGCLVYFRAIFNALVSACDLLIVYIYWYWIRDFIYCYYVDYMHVLSTQAIVEM